MTKQERIKLYHAVLNDLKQIKEQKVKDKLPYEAVNNVLSVINWLNLYLNDDSHLDD